MAHTCIEHPHEQAEGLCRRCGAPHCPDCLVYPFGPTQPPYCVPCAVAASGLRSNAGKRQLVVPKENKRRLKEWRKARKRDLEAPPPDGVATWQRMDETDAEVDEEAAAAKAAAEREALRLPPPVEETPTPPPGVNLAPPGPADEDWRNEITAGTDEAPLLGYLDDDRPPTPMFDTAPIPTDPVDLPPPHHDEFGMGTTGPTPLDEPTPLVVPEETAFEPPAYQPSAPYEPPAYRPTTPVEPPTYDPTAFDPDPVFDGPDHQPIPLRETPAYEPPSYQPSATPEVPAYQPTTVDAEPDLPSFDPPAYAPAAHDAPAAPAFEPPATPPEPYQPVSFDPPAYEPVHQAADPPAPAVFEPAVDPLAASFSAPPPTGDPADAPPLPPATSLADFGLGNPVEEPTAMTFADDPLPPHVSAPPPAATPAAPAPTAGAPGVPPIRPRTPTRIPAAKPAEVTNDAKAMLARIAALRADKAPGEQ